MRMVGDGGEPRSRPLAQERFAWSRALFERTSMALWTVERRSDGQVLGDCGVIPVQGQGPEIELGYRLRKGTWGRGMGTEAAQAAMTHAMAPESAGGLGIARLIAVVHPDNIGSRRVLDKLGLRYVGNTERYYGSEHALFETGPATR